MGCGTQNLLRKVKHESLNGICKDKHVVNDSNILFFADNEPPNITIRLLFDV
jgi:hypothetical protein